MVAAFRIATAQDMGFTMLDSAATGVTFINAVPSFEQMNVLISQYHYNGAGVAIGDINNDGLPDLFLNANFGPDKLYLNKGDFRFEDISAKAGIVGTQSWETGISMIDINNDGFLDIYVCRSGHAPGTGYSNLLYINNGDLTFSEKSLDYGLFDFSHSTQSYFLDYDRDGDLDLYLLNHNPKRTYNYDFSKPEMTRDDQVGDILFRNDQGQFVDVSKDAGIIGKSISYGLGALIGDMNGDLWPDIYVCNDFGERDYFYINNGDGTFREQLVQSMDHISWYSMGGDVADINNDGLLDLMVLDMTASDNYRQKVNMNDMNPEKFWYAVENGLHYQYMINTMQLNLGHEKFSEIAYLAGVAYSDWSWSALFADFDFDGCSDLFITNGYRVDISNKDYRKWLEKRQTELAKIPREQRNIAQELQEALTKLNKQKIPNYLFRQKDELAFENVSASWGLAEPSFSNGVAYADLDVDGDLDLVINNIDQEVFIYRNEAIEKGSANNYLKIALEGPALNRQGIGSRVSVFTSSQTQMQDFYLSRGYLSSVEPILYFGLGDETADSVEVAWYDGSITKIMRPEVNKIHLVKYSNRVEATPLDSVVPLFKDITEQSGLDFRHQENDFDDYQREVLLPHKMSQQGPALTVADVDGNGWEDIFVGGAKDQAAVLFIQNGEGRFDRDQSEIWSLESNYEDVDARFFDADGDGDLDLYVVSGGYAAAANHTSYQDRLYFNDGSGQFSRSADGTLPTMNESGSCVRPADFDLDGDIDLFVGSRAIPGKYPRSPKSFLLENTNGRFIDVTAEHAPMLNQLGLVTDAAWVDVNGNERPDLVVTGEWMYPTILMNGKSRFTELANSHKDRGWWYSVTPFDADLDGDQDLILGNLGLNYKYQASQERPFEIYVDDFDASGSLDIVLGYYDQNTLFPVRGRQCSSEQMPFISEKFKSYDAFAQASLVDIYGAESLNSSLHYQATHFSSVLAINNGEGNFEWQDLPRLAQSAPINDAIVLDFNKDNKPDVFVAGNLFQSEVETPRADAGKGWLLQGDGAGGLDLVPPIKNGVIADGDVKRVCMIQLARGRQAVLVARNNGKLGIYQLGMQ